MKTLILIRHAKSDWDNLGQKDFDRELSPRGLKDAPTMGLRLLKQNSKVDLIISSTAIRASQTASLIARELNYDKNQIRWEEKLYHAPPVVIEDIILETEDQFNSIIIVCHNNGITDFVNSLCGLITENMPTCAMAGFSISCNHWADFTTAKKKLLFYDYPKNR